MIHNYPHEQRPEFWDEQGCFYCCEGLLTEAIAAFDRAHALNPRYSPAWNNRGNAFSGMKRYAEALAAYDRAVALSPQYHQAWFNRGLLLNEMMAYGNALEAYERAIALHPDPRYLHAREDIWLKRKLVSFV